jgi:ligand-binding sensor domain-containing protein/signal transduction histidine kinase
LADNPLSDFVLKSPVISFGLQRNPFLLGFLVFFLMGTWRAPALDPSRSISQYNCQTWRRQNGLPANGVNAIAQTQDGYLWLGTAVGLVRFDGSEFKLLDMGRQPQLRSSIVTSLSSSKQGGLWFGLERSAFGFYDGKKASYRGREEGGGVSQNVHFVLETGDGTTWVGAESRSGRLTKDNTYETFPGIDNSDVTAICQGAQGRVWLGTARRGLYYWQNGVLNRFPDTALDERIVRALLEDKQGKIWVGTELGLLCYDANLKKLPLPYPWYQTVALLMDRRGAIWVGTSGGGIVRFLNDTASALFRQADGLADDFVNTLAEDQEGSLWVGTRNGLSQLSDVKIPTFGRTEGLSEAVNIAVTASRKGGFWVGTSGGLIYFDGTARSYSTNAGLKSLYIKGVLEARNGDVYMINGSTDIEVFSNGKVVARYPNQSQSWPTAMTEDAQGIVAAVGGELYRVGTNGLFPFAFANNQKPALSWVFNMITSRDGSIWGASSDGVFRVKDGTLTLWTKQEGLADSKAVCICEDSDGIIWAGLEAGIARVKNGQIRNIIREKGLFDNIIYSLVPDDYGSLWACSSRGFFRVSRQNLNDFADGKVNRVTCVAYDSLDAVKTFERSQQELSGCRTVDGRIWFPTSQGIVMIDPTNITVNPVPPPVYVHTVRANGRELNEVSQAIVGPGKGELEFHYAGLSYIAPQKIQYRYRLEGYDKEYVQAGTRRSAFYTNLKPGPYAFQVQACNADGVWGTGGATFTIELRPHFYQTIWFITLMGASVVLVLLGIYGWRVRHLEWKQKKLQQAHDLLETKVKERTVELAASNTSLKSEIEERKRMELEVERIHRQLVDASRMAGQAEVASSVLHNVGNVLNSVNVSTTLIAERLQKMRLANLAKAVQLMQEHAGDLGRFLTADDKGKRLPQYLEELSRHLGGEQKDMLTEVQGLAHNVEHIKEIVAMQQNYAKISGAAEKVELSDLVESALKMHSAAYLRHSVRVERQFEEMPAIVVDRHKVLQILINIFQNAKYACDEGGQPDKKVMVQIRRGGPDRVTVEIADNGIGIVPENLTRIFSHGFTTRKNGHGFGLHSAALAAKQMGGVLTARSDGVGKGATFTLELPLYPTERKRAGHAPGTPLLESTEKVSP